MNKRISAVILALAFLFVFSSCKKPVSQSYDTDSKLHIISTIFPAYDFARNIAGSYASVSLLLPPGAEVHSFEPTPQDMIDIQKCDLFIYNGGESDEWVKTLLSAEEYKKVRTLRMMDSVRVLDEQHIDCTDEHECDEEAETDEHVWTSPVNAIKISASITDALCDIDSLHSDYYNANFSVYKAHLSALDMEFRNISSKACTDTLVFADRFPMRYFAEEYGFKCYAAFPGCSSQTEPSAATVVFLIDKIRDEHLPAVFCMEFSDGRMADTICSETDAKKFYLYSCHNVSKTDFDNGVTYEQLMQRNIAALKDALHVN